MQDESCTGQLPLNKGGRSILGKRIMEGGNSGVEHTGRSPLGSLTNVATETTAKRQRTELPWSPPQRATPAFASPPLQVQPAGYPASSAISPVGPVSRRALLSAPHSNSDFTPEYRPGITYKASPPRSNARGRKPNPIFWDLGTVLDPTAENAGVVNAVGAAVTEMFTRQQPRKTISAGSGVHKEQAIKQFSLHEVAAFAAGKYGLDPTSSLFDIPTSRLEEVRQEHSAGYPLQSAINRPI